MKHCRQIPCDIVAYTRDENFNLNIMMVRDRRDKDGGEWRLPRAFLKDGESKKDCAIRALVETPITEFEPRYVREWLDGDYVNTHGCKLPMLNLYGFYYRGPYGVSNDETDPLASMWVPKETVSELCHVEDRSVEEIECFFYYEDILA